MIIIVVELQDLVFSFCAIMVKLDVLNHYCNIMVNVQKAISKLPCASVSKGVPVQKNLSFENQFDLHEK